MVREKTDKNCVSLLVLLLKGMMSPLCNLITWKIWNMSILSQMYKCIGVIVQTGKSSFGLFISMLVF